MIELPDWKDPGAYPKPGEASNARFAWEFLRRNAGYQATWREYVAALREGAAGDPEVLRLIDYFEADRERQAAMVAEHYATPDLWNAAMDRLCALPCWRRRMVQEGGAVRLVPLDRALAEPWGLQRLVSPRQSWWDINTAMAWLPPRGVVHQPTSAGVRQLEQESGLDPHRFIMQGRWLVVAIDLERPLEVIEAALLESVRSERKARTKAGHVTPLTARARSPRQLADYLRILDARARSVPYSRIGEVLCPGEPNPSPDYPLDKRLRAAFKEACRLRDGGYRVLPLLADKSKRRRKE